jgi:regulator of cell morphogenesis and NO signaling
MNATSTTTAHLEEGTVNEIVRLHPPTVEVFNRHGIDACCGGAVSVRDAAVRDGADPEALLAALREAVGA